jgi:diguanylate cyclase (GGDEF)-like protein
MIVALTVACALALAAGAGWLRARRQLNASVLTLRLARESEAAFRERARRLGEAARQSVAALHAELERALRATAPALDCIVIFEADESVLTCVAAAGARVAYFNGVRIARTDRTRLPAAALALGHRVALGEPGVRAFHPADAFALAVPLQIDSHGAVVYVAAPVPLDAATTEALVAVIDHAGFAYVLALEREADRRRAEVDALTGLLTPRSFRERLAALLERARFAPLARIALVFVDTDRFKDWNDAYGHASGDALLRALARVLRNATQAGELAARNGGDEFCLVFIDTEKSQAIVRAEALRNEIAALDLAALRPPDVTARVAISASVGIAAYPADARSSRDLLERADAAMYFSKRNGRNVVSYYAPDGAIVVVRDVTRTA